MRLRRAVARLALLVCSTMAGLALLEYGVRLLVPAYDPSRSVAFTVLPDGTPIGRAGTTGRLIKNTGDYDVDVTFNAIGFRDPKPLHASTRHDIFVVGDSFGLGWGVSEAQRFSDLLQARLRRPVYNLGVAAADLTGYAHVLDYARRHGATLDTLVATICLENDLASYDEETSRVEGWRDAVKIYLSRRSAAYFLASSAVHRAPRLARAAERMGFIVPNLAPPTEARVPEGAIEESVRRLRGMLAGRRSVALIVPSRGLWAGTPEHRRETARVHESFVSRLRQSGIEVVDMRERLERGGDPLGFHFPNDGHWNAAGHRAAADALAERFARHAI